MSGGSLDETLESSRVCEDDCHHADDDDGSLGWVQGCSSGNGMEDIDIMNKD